MNIFWAGHNWTIIKVDTNRQTKRTDKSGHYWTKEEMITKWTQMDKS